MNIYTAHGLGAARPTSQRVAGNVRSAVTNGSRRAIKAGLHLLGVGVRLRKSPQAIAVELYPRGKARSVPEPPPIFDDPLEAIYSERGNKAAAFHCPVNQCVHTNGLNFSADGWHPCSALLEQIESGVCESYEGSILERYYETWRPQSAKDALIGLGSTSSALDDLSSHLMYLFPWMARTPEEADMAVRAWAHGDNIEHGHPDLSIDTHGFKDHGPVDRRVGELEFERLRQTFATLSRSGYDRTKSDVSVLIIKRADDYRFLNFGGGLHRTAAMKVLGHETVPAKPQRPWVIDVDDVNRWPQVRSGIWSRTAAIRYVDHLFDFDSAAWARRHGLLAHQQPA